MTIAKITTITEKQTITRTILEALPDWFGIPEAREEYIEGSKDNIFFCAYEANQPVGFLYIKETGKDTAELAVMGVLKEYHRHGIGKALFEHAKAAAREADREIRWKDKKRERPSKMPSFLIYALISIHQWRILRFEALPG